MMAQISIIIHPFPTTKPLTFWGFPDNNLALPKGFHLNTEDFSLKFRPINAEVTKMAFRISEFRNGQFIGSTMRDIPFFYFQLFQ